MTTNDAAAARPWKRSVALAALAALFGAGLSGCGTSGNLLGNDATAAAPQAAVVQPPTPAPAAKQQARIAVAPIIGAPDSVAKQLTGQLTDAMGKQKVPVASSGDKAEYTIRGYIVAAKEKAGTKVSYIWDVADPTGKRVNRVTGEEMVAGSQNAKDPWSSVTPQLMQTIADRTATQIAQWLPTQEGAQVAAAGTPPPSGTGVPVTPAAAQAGTPPAATPGRPLPATATATPPATPASAPGSGELRISMPRITGAPGDGEQALSDALQREMSKNGVAIGDRPGASAYKVEGKVTMGQGREGRQPIQIDWIVRDGNGNRLGTVSQKNEVEQGSLDGAWGQNAEMAASAAAQGIIKLMQPTPRT